MAERRTGARDQAEGLRRIFGGVPARVAPVLVGPGRVDTHVASIVRLAQASARIGQRTLVLDCARAQIAATLGLRARFDLLHALRGECRIEQVRLDAGPDLGIVPAARALAQARGAEAEFLRMLGALTSGPLAADLVLMIVDPVQAMLVRGQHGEVVVPVARQPAGWSALLRSLALLGDGSDIAGFRLLFPAWETDAAARLYDELDQVCSDRLGIGLRFGGAVQVAQDWLRVARAMSEWDLLRLPRSQIARTF